MSFFSNIKLIADFLGTPHDHEIEFQSTYHQVAQAFGVWPVVVNDEGYKIRLFEWGLVADYMNTLEKIKATRTSMANARSEKILDDSRSAWYRLKKKRCLVFTTGFFEHHDAGLKKKVPFFIQPADCNLLCVAGLYNYSPIPDPTTGEIIGTFTVVTRPANSLMAKIHNGGANSGRMPLMLTKELALQWLDHQTTDEQLRSILQYEHPESMLKAWPVNTIRTRKNDDEAVIKEFEWAGFGGI